MKKNTFLENISGALYISIGYFICLLKHILYKGSANVTNTGFDIVLSDLNIKNKKI